MMNTLFIVLASTPERGEMFLISGGAAALGILAWVLPYKWNPFRLRRTLRGFLSEGANQMVPKILGTVFILIGIDLGIMALVQGE